MGETNKIMLTSKLHAAFDTLQDWLLCLVAHHTVTTLQKKPYRLTVTVLTSYLLARDLALSRQGQYWAPNAASCSSRFRPITANAIFHQNQADLLAPETQPATHSFVCAYQVDALERLSGRHCDPTSLRPLLTVVSAR